MGLASKFFLAASLVILALLAVAGRSLLVLKHLVEVNRDIVTRTVPALKLEASLQQPLARLDQLYTRYVVLRDRRYATFWGTQAEGVEESLEALGPYLVTGAERKQYRKLLAGFARYRQVVGGQLREVAPAEPAAQVRRAAGVAADQVERGLARLIDTSTGVAERMAHDALLLEQRTWNSVLPAILGSVLATMAAAWLLAQRMTRTVHRLSIATAEMAQGSFTGPIKVESRDEIGELAQAFNRMAERLSEVDRLKHEFFSHISHELRTPLTAIREAAHLLGERVLGALEPKQARLVEIIGASTERTLLLVNRILELSRLRAGLLQVDRRWVDLDELVGRACQELLPQAEARGLALNRNGTGGAMVVFGDWERLLEVLVNLIGNAIKFTPPGGAVRVALVRRGDRIEIAIEDTGTGIPARALERIFEPYYQVRGVQGGTGLGLAIVKGIVEAHGGGVRAESLEGRGSRFTVSLPRKGVGP